MGNDTSSHKAESERARKRKIDDRIEVSKELRENTNDLISAIKSNFFNINKICPCFELDYFFFKNKALKEIKNDIHDYTEKTNYLQELIDKINQYQIEADGESVLKYSITSCPHFYCMKCKESKKNKPCIYCENYITDNNLACFVNMGDIEVKNAFRHIIYKYNGRNVSEIQYSRFKKKLISEASNFLLTNNNINAKIKKKLNAKDFKKETPENKKKEEKNGPKKKNKEKKISLKQQHKAFYNILKINKDYINYICPYCLKNKEGQDVIDLAKESIDSSPSENEMKEHLNLISVQINTDRILDLRSVLKFRFKCEHFYHKECKEKVKDKTCFYCKFYLNPLNLACFNKKNWNIHDQEDIWEVTAKFRGKRYKRRIGEYDEYPVIYKEIYYEVRQFLYTYPVILEEYRQKFISLYKLTQEFSMCYYLYKYDYDIDFKINISQEKRKELEEELEKAKIKQKKMENDKWEKRMKEIKEECEGENDDDDNSDDNNYTHRNKEGNNKGNDDNTGYKLKVCYEDCNKKCFLCNKKEERLQPKNLYAHKSCHNKENCFVCKKNNKGSSDIKICPKCKDKFRGTNYDFKCYICKGKINQFNN